MPNRPAMPSCTGEKPGAVVTAEPNPASREALSDEALLSAIAVQADRAAFAELFGRFAGRVKSFVMRGGMAPEQAEEIAQEVMITVWRKAASFDAARAGAATWIFTIARNRKIDLVRRQARPEPDPEDPLFRPDPPEDPASELAARDRDAHVRAALSELNEDQQAVIRLAFFAGLSHGEVAAQLDVPLGTVKSRLRLAFGRLRDILGSEFSLELTDD